MYTRQPRHSAPIEGTIIEEGATWQRRADTGNPYMHTPRGSLVLDDLKGNITVIHDCSGPQDICVAGDPAVSPDGKRVLYSVSYGDRLDDIKIFSSGDLLEDWQFQETRAELWIYNLATGGKQRLTTGHRDRQPRWLSNTAFVFASDRAGVYPPWSPAGPYYPWKALQIHRTYLTNDRVGEIVNLTPHALFAMNPWVMTTGDVCFSSWNGNWPRDYSTPPNAWWIECMNANGAGNWVELGAHGSPHIQTTKYLTDWVDPARRGEALTEFRSLRPPVEIHPGYISVINYYRFNSGGSCGMLLGWPFDGGLPEGVSILDNFLERSGSDSRPGSGRYVPANLVSMTPYGTDQDSSGPRYHQDGRAAGRACEAAPWPGDGPRFMFVHQRGWGADYAWPEMVTRKAMGGEPTRKLEIRLALVEKVTNPFDLQQSICIAACGEQWHAWGAQPVATYQELHGQPAPLVDTPAGGQRAFLEVVNARAAQLHPIPGREDAKHRLTFQGNASADYARLVDKFCVQEVSMWTRIPPGLGWPALGEKRCAKVAEDGHVLLEVQPDVPFLMHGESASGEVVAQDNMLHSVRPGEVRACHGCHDGHATEGSYRQTPEERLVQRAKGAE